MSWAFLLGGRDKPLALPVTLRFTSDSSLPLHIHPPFHGADHFWWVTSLATMQASSPKRSCGEIRSRVAAYSVRGRDVRDTEKMCDCYT